MKAMKVLFAKNDGKNIQITFNSYDNVKINDFFEIKVYDKTFTFQANVIQIAGGILTVTATESGYWANKLFNMRDISLYDIVDTEIYPIKDEEKIKRLKDESLLL